MATKKKPAAKKPAKKKTAAKKSTTKKSPAKKMAAPAKTMAPKPMPAPQSQGISPLTVGVVIGSLLGILYVLSL